VKKLIVIGIMAGVLLVGTSLASASGFRVLAKQSGYEQVYVKAWTKNYSRVYFGAFTRNASAPIGIGYSVACYGGFYKTGGAHGLGTAQGLIRIPYGQGRCVERLTALTGHYQYITGLIAVPR